MDYPAHPPPLLDTPSTAKILGLKPRTLEEWRRRGGGPQFIRLSATCVRYSIDSLNEWISERTATSIAQEAARAARSGSDQ